MQTNKFSSRNLLSIARILRPASFSAKGASTPRQAHHTRRPSHETPRRGSARWPAGFVAITVALLLLACWMIPLRAQAAKPGAPTGLTAEDGVDSFGGKVVRLDWSAPSGGATIDSYHIRYKRLHHTDTGWKNLRTVTGGTTVTVHITIPTGKSVYYHVRAHNSNGRGPASDAVGLFRASDDVFDPVNPPDKPRNLTADEDTVTRTVDLEWAAPSTTDGSNGNVDVTGYLIKRRIGEEGSWRTAVTDTKSPDTSYSDPITADMRGQVVFYRVRAINPVDKSGQSNMAETDAISTVPDPPTNLAATRGAQKIFLNWVAPANDGGYPIIDYRIESRPGSCGSGSGGFSVLERECSGIQECSRPSYTHPSSADDDPLPHGATYCYRVSAKNELGFGDPSDTEDATTWTLPTPPTGIVAEAESARAIRLRWEEPVRISGDARIIGYRVEYSLVVPNNDSWEYVGNIVSENSYTHTGLSGGQTVYYRIQTKNEAGIGLPSGIAIGVTDAATVPGRPTGLEATGGSRQIALTWTAPVNDGGADITGYRIDRWKNSSTGWLVHVEDTGSSTPSYNDTGLDGNQRFYYRVSAINDEGPSAASSYVSARTAPPTVPDAPTGLIAEAGAGSISLSWTAPVDDGGARITGYRIEHATVACDSSPSFTELVEDTDDPAARYTNTGLGAGVTRCYRVSAINEAGTGVHSDTPAGATTWMAPNAPTGLTAEAGAGWISLSWTAPVNTGGIAITGYRIERARGTCSSSSTFTPLVEDTGSTTVRHTDTGLGTGAPWCYRVSAITLAGTGAASAPAGATTWTLPGAPTGLMATAGAGLVTLNWTAPEDTGGSNSYIWYYQVERWFGGSIGWGRRQIILPPSTTYTDFSLSAHWTYEYRIKAFNLVGAGPASSTESARTLAPAAPYPPGYVTATGENGQISLTWTWPTHNGGSAITGFKVESHLGACSSSGTFTLVSVRPAFPYSYTHTGLPRGQTRCYRVKSINQAVGESDGSDPVVARTLTVPGAPTLVSAIIPRGSEVLLDWMAHEDDGGSPVTGYRIQRSIYTTWSGWSAWINLVINTNSSDTNYREWGYDTSYRRKYRVYAINALGESPASSEMIATVPVDSRSRSRSMASAPPPQKASVSQVAAPGAPSALTATGAAGQVALSWMAPASDGGAAITGYRVQRSDTGLEGSWTVRASDTQTTNTIYTDSGLASGRIFHYRVAAINSAGRSAWSESARAATTLSAEEILSSRGTLRGFGGSHAGNTLAGLAGRLGRSALDSQSRRVSIGGQDMSVLASFKKSDDEEGRPDARQAMESVMGLLGVRLPESGELAQGLAAPGAASPAAGFEMGALPTSGVARASRTGRGLEGALSGEGLDFRSRSKREWIAGSSFEVPLSGTGNGFVDEAGQAGGGWTVWGKAAHSEFDGGDSQSSNQETLSGYMGMDFQGGGNWLMGVAVGSSANDPVASDEWKFNLASVTQYAQWSPTPKFHIHGLVSVGRGDASRAMTGGGELGTELETRMAALGMESVLYQQGRSEFSVKGDALMVSSTLGATEAFPEIRADEHRVRVMFEGKHGLNEGGKVPTQFSLDVAARMDGSDIDESSYLELGTGFESRYATLGLQLEANGRFLVAQSEQDHEEWGASLSASFDPGVRGDGISLSLESNLGVSASRAREIWSDRKMRVRRGGFSHARSSFDVELAYGADLLSKRLRLEPFGEFGFVDAGLSDLRFGARTRVGDWGVLHGRSPLLDNMQIEFFSERENLRSADSEHRHGIEVKIAF